MQPRAHTRPTSSVPSNEARPGAFGAIRQTVAGAGWIYAYIALQFGCQLALLSKELAPARLLFRSSVFGGSLALLLLVPGKSRTSHPVRTLAVLIMTILTFSAFNPNGGPPLAVAAHWAMYLAVLAPLFWVARLHVDERTLERLLLLFWAFHTISSVFGLLQVFFPGRFQPALTTFILEKQALTIRLASGEFTVRPMGLTDIPGGAAGSGLYATLIGIGVVLTRPFPLARLVGLVSMITGITCVYLSQVRSALVMLGICFVVLLALLTLSARLPRAAGLLLITAAVIFVGFELAVTLAADTVTDRLASLVKADPATVYRINRGLMVEEAFRTLLPKHPLGAGLGHWGMISMYFGSTEREFGAEVQWVGWIIDGGILLVLIYPAAVLLTILYAMRLSVQQTSTRLEGWAAVIAAYNVGTFALCFSYVPFMSAAGLEFWLLNVVLLQVAALRRKPWQEDPAR